MTKAAREYRASSAMVAALLALEGNYQDPPSVADRSTVEGLRGGAVVLMVGAFENYLKQSVSELLAGLNTSNPPIHFGKLPLELRTQVVYTALESAMKPKPWDPIKARNQRLPQVMAAATAIHRGVIQSAEVANTAGNPNSDQVTEIYKKIGYNPVFKNIKQSFDRDWGQATAGTFIQDTLDAVVGRRHAVAHTASILNISRGDLFNWHRFLNTLVDVLDEAAERHVQRLATRAR